jgi:hypothetical protein
VPGTNPSAGRVCNCECRRGDANHEHTNLGDHLSSLKVPKMQVAKPSTERRKMLLLRVKDPEMDFTPGHSVVDGNVERAPSPVITLWFE